MSFLFSIAVTTLYSIINSTLTVSKKKLKNVVLVMNFYLIAHISQKLERHWKYSVLNNAQYLSIERYTESFLLPVPNAKSFGF